ncbi:unnamed protein product [Ectocarpus sp. CCAP 1310/34]|nr:unnamed protein product [Ectocarpus sp. CCAP 1310/34]
MATNQRCNVLGSTCLPTKRMSGVWR